MASCTAQKTQSFQLISSLRYDPDLPGVISRNSEAYPEPLISPYYLLAFHRDRLIAAARHFQWAKASQWLQQDLSDLEHFIDGSIPDRQKPWRLRIAVDFNGNGSVDVNPTAAINPRNLSLPLHSDELSIWRVYVDTQPTNPSGFTTHKTTARDEYVAARTRAGITSPMETAEVLVVNADDEVMEGSITTPYFRRREAAGEELSKTGSDWITPPLSSGGNAGTTRRYALAQGFCTEQVITRATLVDGEECWLSNGVRGFMHGIVVLRR